jgi:hypothetical protein
MLRPLTRLDKGSFHRVPKPRSRTVASSPPAIQRTVTCFPTMLRCHLCVAPPKRIRFFKRRRDLRHPATRPYVSPRPVSASNSQFARVSSACLRRKLREKTSRMTSQPVWRPKQQITHELGASTRQPASVFWIHHRGSSISRELIATYKRRPLQNSRYILLWPACSPPAGDFLAARGSTQGDDARSANLLAASLVDRNPLLIHGLLAALRA